MDFQALAEVFESVVGNGLVVHCDGLEAEPAAPQIRLHGKHEVRQRFTGPVGIDDRLIDRGGSGGIM